MGRRVRFGVRVEGRRELRCKTAYQGSARVWPTVTLQHTKYNVFIALTLAPSCRWICTLFNVQVAFFVACGLKVESKTLHD